MPSDPGAALAPVLLEALRRRLARPGLTYAEVPVVMKARGENLVARLSLAGAPEALAGPLILRLGLLGEDGGATRFEGVLHAALREQGQPAPAVHLWDEGGSGLGGAWLLMERAPGRVLLGDVQALDRVFASLGSTARRLPRLLGEAAGRVPRELARGMLRLHALDAGRVRARLAQGGVAPEALSLEARLERVEGLARAADAEGLLPGLAWLRAHQPPTRAPVLCHGDFHFLNLLVDGPRLSAVLDWSFRHVTFADRWFDVGNTRAILSLSLPGLPRALRPVVTRFQRLLRDRFTRLYAREAPLDAAALRWAEAFRYLRELATCAEQFREPPDELPGLTEIPWILPEVRDGVLAEIERLTGVRVSVPAPRVA